MSQRARATISLSALRDNVRVVRQRAPGTRVCAAIKADGYGHGMLQAAQALGEADVLAVAGIAAGQRLRAAGETRPIILLSDPLFADDEAGVKEGGDAVTACAAQGFEPVLFNRQQLQALAASHDPLRVWLKIDSGMHRLGFAPEDAAAVYEQVRNLPHVTFAGWLTHLACADDRQDDATNRQLACFQEATAGLPGTRSIANSAGICAWPETHVDLVRPGIMLYGASPLVDTSAEALGLTPVMTLQAPLLSVGTIAAGERIGYGGTWQTPEAMPVGVVAIGYGDGYPRHAPSGTPVLINGRRVPLVGRVSMDMITVDLRDCPDAAVGDMATLWGDGLPADEIATASGTIAYELFCQLTSRVVFEYR